MAINLNLLRQFAAVVEHGGVGAAARAMRLSQPAISRALRELERQVGLSLLERSSRGVRLTTEGEEIYAHARGVYAAERVVEEAIDGLRGLQHGTLHIGASTTIAAYVLPEAISAFARSHPRIDVRLTAVHTRSLVHMLRHYELDAALAEAPVDDKRIRVAPWRTDEMLVIASPSHRFAGRRSPVAPSALADELIILREPESGTRTIVLEALAAAGVDVQRSMAVDSTEVIKQLVAEGLGIAVVSRFAVRDQLELGRLVTLNVDGLRIRRPFSRLTMRGRRLSSATRAFLALIARPPATAPARTARPRTAAAR